MSNETLKTWPNFTGAGASFILLEGAWVSNQVGGALLGLAAQPSLAFNPLTGLIELFHLFGFKYVPPQQQISGQVKLW